MMKPDLAHEVLAFHTPLTVDDALVVLRLFDFRDPDKIRAIVDELVVPFEPRATFFDRLQRHLIEHGVDDA